MCRFSKAVGRLEVTDKVGLNHFAIIKFSMPKRRNRIFFGSTCEASDKVQLNLRPLPRHSVRMKIEKLRCKTGFLHVQALATK